MKFGGHELAAGLSLERENLSGFIIKINDYAQVVLKGEGLIQKIYIDYVL